MSDDAAGHMPSALSGGGIKRSGRFGGLWSGGLGLGMFGVAAAFGAAALLLATLAHAEPAAQGSDPAGATVPNLPPLQMEAGAWRGSCESTGLCVIASGQLEIVRSWEREAPLALCTFGGTGAASRVNVTVDGRSFIAEADPRRFAFSSRQMKRGHEAFYAYLRQRLGGGSGLCAPTFPSPQLLAAMVAGKDASVAKGAQSMPLSLDGFAVAAGWMDARQQRSGTVGAMLNPGEADPVFAPHAAPLLKRDELPSPVRALYAAPGRNCQDIRKDVFDAAGAARVALGAGRELFLLPCGQPGTNQPFAAITLQPDGNATDETLAFVSDGKRLHDKGGMNLIWDGLARHLVGTQAMGRLCSVRTIWAPAQSGFTLVAQQQRIGCGKPDAGNARDWEPVALP